MASSSEQPVEAFRVIPRDRDELFRSLARALLTRLHGISGELKELRAQHAAPGPLGSAIARSKLRHLSSQELVGLRKRLGLSQEQLAQWLDVSWVSVSRWERDRGHPAAREARILARLAEIVETVGDRLTPQELVRFFGEPHEDLYADRPVEVLATELGYRTVRHLLEGLLTGEYA